MWSPLGHEPLNQGARWQPEPTSRGTFNILSTCLTTLVLCVWTALHLNIPENENTSHRRGRKIKWLLLGLLVPEVVTIVAFQQWLRHKRLTKAMKDNLGMLSPTPGRDVDPEVNQIGRVNDTQENYELMPAQTEQESYIRRRYPWTPVHSFYAIMGGFVFEPSRSGREQIAIDQSLLVWLSENEPDTIPNISSGHIKDKSKANGLAKFLVCVQVVWYGIQVITRLGQGLAVTLLELNVFAHVLCTLLTYAFWWNKPLDIEVPTAIYMDDAKADSICAAIWSRGRMGWRTPLMVQREGQPSTEVMRDARGRAIKVDQVVFSPQGAEELRCRYSDAPSAASQQGCRHISTQGYDSEHVILRLNIKRPHDQKRFNFGNLSKDPSTGRSMDRIFIELNSAVVRAELERLNIDHHTDVFGPNDRIYVAFKDHHLQHHLYAYTHPAGLKVLGLTSPEFKFRRMRSYIPNWPGLEFDAENAAQTGLFTVASMLYGAFHLMAWNGPFRTAAEDKLWKVSAVCVAAGFIIIMALLLIGMAYGYYIKKVGTSKSLSSLILISILLLLTVLDLLLYWLLILSRSFLVVESFINLAFVPDAAFTVPQWSVYFPHIS